MKSPLETPLDKIRHDCMLLFEQSKGWECRLKGTPFVFIIEDVDWRNLMVVSKTYGSFHVDLCELTGREKQIPES